MRLRLVTRTGSVEVENGLVAAARNRADVSIDLDGATLRPGLVNAHDHLHRNHLPRLGEPPYADARTWGRDLHDRFAGDLERRHALSRREALLFGALKNVLGGVTTAVHHDAWEGDFERDFPVRVPRISTAQSVREAPEERPLGPWTMHLAEGTSPDAREEVADADARGLLGRSLAAVHLVATDADSLARLSRAGCAVVWCPTSNAFLYGATASRALFGAGLEVLLGTDALVSGAGTLLDELAAARAMRLVSDRRLEDAVSMVAARRLGLPVPSLETGAPADLIALRAPLLSARPRDVALVLVAGRPVLADEEFAAVFDGAGVSHEALRVGGVAKRVAAPLGSVARAVVALAPECGRVLS
ncbi:MAG: amidohydrolase family protein [Thermoanaerobaculia bacterium]